MSDYIDRGLRRLRCSPLPVVGDMQHDDAGRYARFSVRVEEEVITQVVFEASMCVTLVAYCEVLAEWVTGLSIADAVRRIRPVDLVAELPLVPLAKREVASLAAQALMMAVVTAARKAHG
jgi:NifU-like protein involved in Fe-S cluster formation